MHQIAGYIPNYVSLKTGSLLDLRWSYKIDEFVCMMSKLNVHLVYRLSTDSCATFERIPVS